MNPIFEFFLTIPFGGLLVKIFIIVFAILFVMYSFLILGQTSSLRKTVVTEHGDLIYFISMTQLIVALAVLVIALLY